MLSKIQLLDLNLGSKWYFKIDLLHQIIMPWLRGGGQHSYSTKKGRRAGPMSSLYIFLEVCGLK
jgi:hypothetical protein